MRYREIISERSEPMKELRASVARAMVALSSEEIIPDDFIRDTRKDIKRLERISNLTAFRLYGVPSPSAIRTDHMGQHWTLDWDALSNHENFYVPPNSNLYVVQAGIDANDIDVPITIAYRYLFPEECEVFMSPDASLYLSGVFDFPNGETHLTDADGKYYLMGVRAKP